MLLVIDIRNRDKIMKSKVVVYGLFYGKWYVILVNDGVVVEFN